MKTFISLLLACISFSAHAQITSTFDTDADGWTFLNSTTTLIPNHSTTGGNPAGFISVTYSANVSPITQSWIAPVKFRGNHLVRSLGMNLSFDLQQSLAGTNSNVNGDVRIESTSFTLVFSLPTKPATAPAWSSYSLKLDETQGWRINSTSGAFATRAQIKSVLKNITSIEIRGTYVTNASYISAIDNVVLDQRILNIPPAITSFSPLSGEPGISLTILGNNFDPTASNNVVHFGTIAAAISSASSTQLVVNVPVGTTYEKITIINKITGLSNTSSKPFSPTFKGGGRIIPASFGARIDFATISNLGMVVADVDGDGWPDLTITNNLTNNVVDIYRNLGLGGELTTASFAPKISVPTLGIAARNGAGLKFSDLDGDGKPDAITSNPTGPGSGQGSFVTLRNISTPSNIAFETAEYWPVSYQYASPIALVTDVDGDGRPELIAGSGSCTCVEINFWVNQNLSTPGDIEFGPSVAFFNGTIIDGSRGTASEDMDGDGKNDLVISSNGYVFLRNISTPGVPAFEHSFTLPISQTGSTSYDPTVMISDFNLDGKNDIAWKDYGGAGDVHIRLNTDTNGILEATDFATEVLLNGDLSGFGGIAIADFNGDGKPDIIATDNSDIGVFENIYSGGVFDANAFVPAYEVTGGGANTYPTHPVARDLNGDGKPDIIFSLQGGGSRISILQNNNIHTPVISVNTVSPLKGPIGSTVTITGSNFSTITSENRVWFGGVEANVISATATEIKAEVPAGAGYERVSVVRGKLTSYYHLPFNVTFSPGVIFDGTSFLPPVTLPLTGANYDVEVADLNNDGKPDIVAESNVSFFQGLAYRNVHTTGAITSASLILDDTTSTASQDLKLMDVDADGKLDILSSHGIYKNSSTTSEISFDVVSGLNSLRFSSWADFNLDGMIDIVSITSSSGNLSVYENRYRGYGAFITGAFPTFSAAINLLKPAINGGAVSADFDSDGLVDLVSTNPGTDNIRIWRNTSAYRIVTSQFTSVGDINAGDNPGRIYAGDLDSDGKMDLVLYHGTGTTATLIIIFHNTSSVGNISFNRIDLTNPSATTVAHIADLDGDGRPEIITTSETGNRFSIFKNIHTTGALSAASFASPFNTTVTAPRGLTTGDINLDGKPEIIITRAAGFLVVYENLIPVISISFTSQPTNSSVCAGATATFSTAASGTTNITYQWQFASSLTGVYADIANAGGYSGTGTNTLSVNTTGNFGAGFYRCQVNGDGATTVFSSAAQLTVNAIPAAPTITDGFNCGPGNILLSASGATNGEYRWYTLASGGSAVTGEVNAAYSTPSLTSSTSYYVSINNGNCESTRAEVKATILTPPTAPAITVGSSCGPGSVTLQAAGATNGQYRWYDVPTGGTSLAGEINNSFITPALTVTTTYYVSINNGSCESTRTAVITTILSVPSKPTITSNEPINAGVVELCLNAITLSAPSGFTYTWSGGQTTQQIFNVQPGNYSVVVKDASGCNSISSDVIQVVANTSCVNSAPIINTTTVITTIGGFVSIDLSDLISDPDNNLDPASLQVIGNATQRGGKTTLSGFILDINYSGINFSGDDLVTIRICDQLGVCIEKQFAIEVIGDINVYNGISPNGDGKNDTWIIEYIDLFPDTQTNKVTLYNRWGDLVWEASNYDNTSVVFSGLNKNGGELSTGSYFYKIEFEGGRASITGYLSLKR